MFGDCRDTFLQLIRPLEPSRSLTPPRQRFEGVLPADWRLPTKDKRMVCYLPPAMDWHTRQWRMQIAVYSLYRRAIGRPWHYPTLPAEPKSWEVTKSIRGIGVSVFGRTIWLVVPMVIARVPIDDGRH
jgi:hypothetical protein